MTTITPEEVGNLRRMAVTFRRMLLVIGIELIITIPGQLIASYASTKAANAMMYVVGLLGSAALCYLGYKLATLLGRGAIFWAIMLFVPFLNLLALAMLSRDCQKVCRKYNLRVGLLGPTMSDLDRLEQATRAAAPVSVPG